ACFASPTPQTYDRRVGHTAVGGPLASEHFFAWFTVSYRTTLHRERHEDDRTAPGDRPRAVGLDRSSRRGGSPSPRRRGRQPYLHRHGLPDHAAVRGRRDR